MMHEQGELTQGIIKHNLNNAQLNNAVQYAIKNWSAVSEKPYH